LAEDELGESRNGPAALLSRFVPTCSEFAPESRFGHDDATPIRVSLSNPALPETSWIPWVAQQKPVPSTNDAFSVQHGSQPSDPNGSEENVLVAREKRLQTRVKVLGSPSPRPPRGG